MQTFYSEFIEIITSAPKGIRGVSCVTICHNEMPIIKQFVDHYRSIGVSQFFVVDDKSIDGTREYLREQPDVTLFQPREKSHFKNDLAHWRQDILDFFLDKHWATLPDVDEFLYYKEMPAKIDALTNKLDTNSDETLLAVMIDMYQDRPISESNYSGNKPLIEEFPYFDGQGTPPFGMRIISQSPKYLKRFPTPEVLFKGGVRDRLFFLKKKASPLQKWVLERFAHFKRPINPTFIHRIENAIVNTLTKNLYASDPPVLNKFALIKWRKGLKFRRAPHCVNEKLQVSESLAAFLHFKFYKGEEAIAYNVKRAQHTGDSSYYKMMLEDRENLERSPVCNITRRFTSISSLDDIIR